MPQTFGPFVGDQSVAVVKATGTHLLFDGARLELVAAIARLPDEAFGWLVGVLDNTAHTAGGFRVESRAALEAIAPLVRTYFASQQGK